MGIVRLSERDVVRLSTHARERGGQPASSEADGVGQRHEVAPASLVDIEAQERARHSTADRTCVRRRPSSEGETSVVS